MTYKPRKQTEMMMIGLPVGSTKLIPKPSVGLFRPKDQRWYNWGIDDETGKPQGQPFQRKVPRDQYHLRLLVKGDVVLVDEKKPKVSPKAVKKDKE